MYNAEVEAQSQDLDTRKRFEVVNARLSLREKKNQRDKRHEPLISSALKSRKEQPIAWNKLPNPEKKIRGRR